MRLAPLLSSTRTLAEAKVDDPQRAKRAILEIIQKLSELGFSVADEQPPVRTKINDVTKVTMKAHKLDSDISMTISAYHDGELFAYHEISGTEYPRMKRIGTVHDFDVGTLVRFIKMWLKKYFWAEEG